MAVPVTTAFTVGEKPTAAKLNANTKTAIDFLLNPPAGAWYNSAVQTFTTATWTDITWNVEEFDTDNMWTSGAGITIVTPGIYLVNISASFTSNATGFRGVQLLKNAVISGVTGTGNAGAGSPTRIQHARLLRLVAGDVLKAQGYQASGGNLTNYTATSEYFPRIEVLWKSA